MAIRYCHSITGLAAGFCALFPPLFSAGQTDVAALENRIDQIARGLVGRVGVYAELIETGESVSYNAARRYPMQSVYKFPIAMAVLAQVDKGALSLEQDVEVDTAEYIPDRGHSPLRDKYPRGVHLTIRELLYYNVAESDGTACDVLLRLIGGTQKAQEYVRSLGITDIAIATTEQVQVPSDIIQYRNWATPEAMTRLFRIFYTGRHLSAESKELLIKQMSHSGPWFDRRIKGLLPQGTPVFHKTGSSATVDGFSAATNDAGIITLPDGRHLAITVFISDAYAPQKVRENTIAKISRAIFDHYVN